MASDRSPHIELIDRLQSLIELMRKLRGEKDRCAEFEEAIATFQQTAQELKNVCIHQEHAPEALRRLRGLVNVIRIADLTFVDGYIDETIEAIGRHSLENKGK